MLAAPAEGLELEPEAALADEGVRPGDIVAWLGINTPQMLARIGYAESVGPSPRWPLQTKVLRTRA